MRVEVQQDPPKCLEKLSHREVEKLLRLLVMNDFQNTSAEVVVELDPEDNVCNIHILDDGGTAQFRYYCCQRNEFNELHCKYLEPESWLKVLFVIIIIIKVLVVLFAPRFVPEAYYRVKHIEGNYVYKCLSGKRLLMNVTITNTPELYPNATLKAKLCAFNTMENFKAHVSTMRMDEPRQFTLDSINVRSKYDNLLPEDYAPVSLGTALIDTFFKCKLRERAAVRDCCYADFMVKSPCGCGRGRCTWLSILLKLMKVLLLWLLLVPWAVRVWAYYEFEDKEMVMRKDAVKARGLRFPLPANFTLLLTPIHHFFLAMYVLLVLETLVYGVVGSKVQEKLKVVIRQAFRDMREVSRVDVFGWIVRVLIRPCRVYGGCGIIIGIFYWILALPVVALVVAFYIFPTLNIVIRLLGYFVLHLIPTDCFSQTGKCGVFCRILKRMKTKLEMDTVPKQDRIDNRITGNNRFYMLFVIILCLITMFSIIFFLMEFVSFIVEVLVYTLMGIILNADTVMTYVTMVVIVGIYGYQCFGNVTNKFMSFNTKMHNVVLGLCKEDVEKDVYIEKRNAAFIVNTAHSSELKKPARLELDMGGELQWNVRRLCLFLSEKDEPFIPTKFYFSACEMPYYAAPGELLVNYVYATMEFMVIVLFLVFLLIVVLAFGDTYDISITNKLLATAVGALIPFLFRKVIKPPSFSEIDESNIHFQTSLNDLLETYNEDWPVHDLDVEEVDDSQKDCCGQDKPAASDEKPSSEEKPPTKDHISVDVETVSSASSEQREKDTQATCSMDLVIYAEDMNEEDWSRMKWSVKCPRDTLRRKGDETDLEMITIQDKDGKMNSSELV